MMDGKSHITIETERVHLYFGLPANRTFFESLDENPAFLTGDELTEAGIAVLLYAGYCNACLIYDLPIELKRGLFISYVDNACIDDNLKKEMEAAVKAYSESLYTKKYIENLNEQLNDVKKKLSRGMKSKVSATGSLAYLEKNTKNARSGNSGYGNARLKGSRKKKRN
jgi:hypothetical protein